MDIKTIVAAVDLDDDLSNTVIRAAVAMAKRFGAELHVIDAWPPLTGIGFPHAQQATIKAIEEHRASRKQRRDELEAKVTALEPRALTMVRVGDAPDAIATYARNQEADLLVIGSHQKGLFERMMSGGASAEIIHNAPCGLFLVTPGMAESLAD